MTDTISQAMTAKEFREEVVEYFKMRLLICQQKGAHGHAKRANDVLMSEFKYLITFWANVKIGDETVGNQDGLT